MQAAGVSVRRPRARGPMPTESRHGYGGADNVLARQLEVVKPDPAWAGALTDLWTAEGWFYLAVLVDVYSRKVVGWAMSSPSDEALVHHALAMAWGRRRPSAGLLHQADRGRQYASHPYRSRLADHGMICRMSGKGDGLDQAVAERWFGRLQREWPLHYEYATRQEAKDDILAYSEMVYHSRRKPSYLGDVSPNDYEKCSLVA